MNVGTPLDDLYLEWLYRHIGVVANRNKRRSYWGLARKLYTTEFRYFVPNDENRALDGVDLRDVFFDETLDADFDIDWITQECSMFEMILGLAQRADFLADKDVMPGGVGGWFWKFLSNAGLDKFTDNIINTRSLEEIEQKLAIINDRTYSRNCEGGLFPNYKDRKDQRKVELWYQLNAYLLDNGYVDPTPEP